MLSENLFQIVLNPIKELIVNSALRRLYTFFTENFSRKGTEQKGKISEHAHWKCYIMWLEKTLFCSVQMEVKGSFPLIDNFPRTGMERKRKTLEHAHLKRYVMGLKNFFPLYSNRSSNYFNFFRSLLGNNFEKNITSQYDLLISW